MALSWIEELKQKENNRIKGLLNEEKKPSVPVHKNRASFFAQDKPVIIENAGRPAIQRATFDEYEQDIRSDISTTSRRGSYNEITTSVVRRPIIEYSEGIEYNGCVFIDRNGNFMWADKQIAQYKDNTMLFDSLTYEEQNLILSGNIPTYQDFFKAK